MKRTTACASAKRWLRISAAPRASLSNTLWSPNRPNETIYASRTPGRDGAKWNADAARSRAAGSCAGAEPRVHRAVQAAIKAIAKRTGRIIIIVSEDVCSTGFLLEDGIAQVTASE